MFNQNQLAFLKAVAKSVMDWPSVCEESEEMAFWTTLGEGQASVADTFTYEQASAIKFCAKQCEHYNSGAMSVYRMLCVWDKVSQYKNGGAFIPAEILEAFGVFSDCEEDV